MKFKREKTPTVANRLETHEFVIKNGSNVHGGYEIVEQLGYTDFHRNNEIK